MGLIRKSLAVGTLGAVRGSSKKQRVARATLQQTTALVAEQHAANALLAAQAEEAKATRYALDPEYRALVDVQAEQAEQQRLAALESAMPMQVMRSSQARAEKALVAAERSGNEKKAAKARQTIADMQGGIARYQSSQP